MNQRLVKASVLCLCFLAAPISRAEPSLNMQVEIGFLLGYIEGSGCQFYRNDSWYDSRAAQKHLREKYKYLMARNQITVTEDFIEKAASKSSLSGKPYAVKCSDGEALPSNQWLHDELVRLRSY
jgi:hypothetical protein